MVERFWQGPLLFSTRGRRERAQRSPERAQQRLHHDRTVTKHSLEVSSPMRARHLDRARALRILSLLTCWLTRALRCAPRRDETCGLLLQERTRSLPGLVHQGTLHQATGPHPVHRGDRLHQRWSAGQTCCREWRSVHGLRNRNGI